MSCTWCWTRDRAGVGCKQMAAGWFVGTVSCWGRHLKKHTSAHAPTSDSRQPTQQVDESSLPPPDPSPLTCCNACCRQLCDHAASAPLRACCQPHTPHTASTTNIHMCVDTQSVSSFTRCYTQSVLYCIPFAPHHAVISEMSAAHPYQSVPVVLVSAVRLAMSSTSWMGVAVGSSCRYDAVQMTQHVTA